MKKCDKIVNENPFSFSKNTLSNPMLSSRNIKNVDFVP